MKEGNNIIFHNIHKLYIGQIIKNYKELCGILDIPIKTGNAKQSQLKSLEQFILFHKDGNKFIIDEIYNIPIDKKDKRYEKIIYGKYIEKLILDLLVQKQKQDNNKIVNLSTNKLLEALAMININYSYCMEHKPQLASFLNMDKEYVKEFYNLTYSKLINALEGSLKRLENKMLIHWVKTITVYIEEYIPLNGKFILERKAIIANDEMIKQILSIEKSVANDMNLNDKSEIVLHDKWKEFNRKVNDRIQLEIDENIQYYFKSYKIYFNEYIESEQKKLEIELSKENRILNQNELNKKIVSNFKDSNESRYEKNKDDPELINSEWKNQQMKTDLCYVKNTDTLVDTLIDKNAKPIIREVQKHENDLHAKELKQRLIITNKGY